MGANTTTRGKNTSSTKRQRAIKEIDIQDNKPKRKGWRNKIVERNANTGKAEVKDDTK